MVYLSIKRKKKGNSFFYARKCFILNCLIPYNLVLSSSYLYFTVLRFLVTSNRNQVHTSVREIRKVIGLYTWVVQRRKSPQLQLDPGDQSMCVL